MTFPLSQTEVSARRLSSLTLISTLGVTVTVILAQEQYHCKHYLSRETVIALHGNVWGFAAPLFDK